MPRVPLPNGVARVRTLMQYPAFDLPGLFTHPAFCAANPRHFHAADGSGYALAADVISELQAMNMQVASFNIDFLSVSTRPRRTRDGRPSKLSLLTSERIWLFGNHGRRSDWSCFRTQWALGLEYAAAPVGLKAEPENKALFPLHYGVRAAIKLSASLTTKEKNCMARYKEINSQKDGWMAPLRLQVAHTVPEKIL